MKKRKREKYIILNNAEQATMRASGAILRQVQEALRAAITPGVTCRSLDALAEEIIRSAGGLPSFKGFHGFPATLCCMRNDQVVHGIPDHTPLQAGDLLSVDCGVQYKGFHTDAAFSLVVGGAMMHPAREQFQTTVRAALEAAVAVAIAGNTLRDIAAAVESTLAPTPYAVAAEYTGHGIGRQLHAEPHVWNLTGQRGEDTVLQAGMALCIEPIVLAERTRVETLSDGWTTVTANGCDAVQWEHCGIVQTGRFEVLA
ncbi:type I methionyl aminopeptidase [Candidatus Peribacteria bacterium]|nr:type I methionyl aminopeptidase [Candidatus Peribacteria bacterium]